MNVRDLISGLDYDKSASFITPDRFDDDPSRAYVLRRARERCGLQGVYALTDRGAHGGIPGATPVVYVCDSDEAKKDPGELHRLVWNQNSTPFLVVVTVNEVRLYPGFGYDPPEDSPTATHILEVTIDRAVAALRQLNLDATSIDEGSVWSSMDKYVTPNRRVDWRLLGSLRDLGDELNRRLPRRIAHALIGKYVYLRYLRDRGILSDRKLDGWGLRRDLVFGRGATLDSLRTVIERLEEWLNGRIFPLPLTGPEAPSQDDVALVAATFVGDEPRSRQMHLGFQAYDFSYIPIETLSNVYEQFLHAEQEGSEGARTGRARQLGAYYTPVHLVDFVLDELDAKRPLTSGMTAFDPACGSGAFLVQAYRRLVERERATSPGLQLTPARLRDLLVGSVFGVDLDEDACRVAHLSLSLTLLDYVSPPDLENSRYRDFQMPDLTKTNIFHCSGGFFDPSSTWRVNMPNAKFDWIVSNPPWRNLKSDSRRPEERHVLRWMTQNEKERPTGGNQLAEAFAWHVADFLRDNGLAGLLMPAMTLFKAESRRFREGFFAGLDVWCVANFANLREVLFTGLAVSGKEGRFGKERSRKKKRARLPAAAFFYGLSDSGGVREADHILTYAPFVATQEVNRSQYPGQRRDVWKVVVDASEIKQIPLADAATGDRLVWKAAMWGSPRDIRLIKSLRRRFESLEKLAKREDLRIHEGPQLRQPTSSSSRPSEEVEVCEELSGKMRLVVTRLRNLGRIYSIPKDALERIDAGRVYVRKGRKDVPLSVCRPPHVLVDATRRFAVFTNRFIVVPPRHVGIAGRRGQANLLKAIAVYLNSRFATYHDFFVSPEWGVHLVRSDLATLRALPMPLSEFKDHARWASLHDRLVTAFEAEQDARQGLLRGKRPATGAPSLQELEEELNAEVYGVLGLDEGERCLVEDLVRVKLDMIESKWNESLIRPASEEEMVEYASMLRRTMNEFLEDDVDRPHSIAVVYGACCAWVCVSLVAKARDTTVTVKEARGRTADAFDEMRRRLREQHSQWFYFNRGLRVFEGRTTHMFKLRYRLAWLRSQALADADDLIADILTNKDA